MKLHSVVVVGCLLPSFISSFSAPLHLAVAMSKDVYVGGEPVFVNVKVSNFSGSPLTILVPAADSCESAVAVVVEGLNRADLPPCSNPILSRMCGYNRPPAQQIEVLPGKFYEMRRFLGPIYDLQIPREYRAHVSLHLQYADRSQVDPVSSALNNEVDLIFKVIGGDANRLRFAFAPILADLDEGDVEHRRIAELVLLNLAPHFAEGRILALSDHPDVGLEAMPALRKLGTNASLQKLEGIAFEPPDENVAREQIRYAALEQLKYVNDRSLLPKLYTVMGQRRWRAIRWAAAIAAARIAHGEAVPEISTMMRIGDVENAIAGAAALGETGSRAAVEVLISSIRDAADPDELNAIIEALAALTHRRSSSDPADRMKIQRDWDNWWASHHANAKVYGPETCGAIIALSG